MQRKDNHDTEQVNIAGIADDRELRVYIVSGLIYLDSETPYNHYRSGV